MITSRNIALVCFALLATITILFSWFRNGQIIANSEEGLNIYNLQKTVNYYSSVWYPAETGLRFPFYTMRVPIFSSLAIIKSTGLPDFYLQSIFIGIFIFTGIIFAYILANYLSNSFPISVITAYFYLLNLYSLSQIFRRFLYSTMSAWAYYPLFLFLFFKIVKERKIKWVFALGISSLIFCFSFAHPAYLFTYWLSAMVIVIVSLIQARHSLIQIRKIIIYSFLAFLFWSVINIWWLYPTLHSAPGYLSDVHQSTNADLETLKGVSQAFPISQILLLRQSWWFGSSNHWFNFYNQSVIFLISYLILFFVMLGVIFERKGKWFVHIIALILLGLIISKGTNPPFGEALYKVIFNISPLFGALRNSYEKFGLVFLLPYSYFFASGLINVSFKFNQFLKPIFLFFILSLTLIFLPWPVWSGEIFKKTEKLSVPNYYNQVNSYLNSKSDDLRIFQLPLSKSGNLNYSWGYFGQNPTINLFDKSSITDPNFGPLKSVLYKKLSSNTPSIDLSKDLGTLSIGYILRDEAIILDKTDLLIDNNLQDFQKIYQAGSVSVYKIDPKFVLPLVHSIPEDKIINYKKISNVAYQIKIRNLNSALFKLVLNNTYDQSWTAKIDSTIITNHVKINDFANGWLIDKPGEYEVNIVFKVWPWE